MSRSPAIFPAKLRAGNVYWDKRRNKPGFAPRSELFFRSLKEGLPTGAFGRARRSNPAPCLISLRHRLQDVGQRRLGPMHVTQPITLALHDLARGDKTALDRLLTTRRLSAA